MGDSEAYQSLFDRTYQTLHQLAATYVLDKDIANDIVQEVFISIYENARLLQNVSNFGGYLRISVRNRCLNHLRELDLEDKSRKLYYEEFIEVDDIDPKEWGEMLDQVMRAFEELPQSCRQICELRFIKGYKIREIAEQLSLSSGTVKVQLHRGVNKLRNIIEKSPESLENKGKTKNFINLLVFL